MQDILLKKSLLFLKKFSRCQKPEVLHLDLTGVVGYFPLHVTPNLFRGLKTIDAEPSSA